MSRFFVGLQPSSRGISAIAASHSFGVPSAAASSHLEHARRLAVLTVGAGVIAVAGLAASPAMAQDATNPQECQPGGYWYMQSGAGTSVPLACPGNAALAESGGASFEATPKPRRSSSIMATSQQDCEPGGYWMLQTEESPWTSVIMKCR